MEMLCAQVAAATLHTDRGIWALVFDSSLFHWLHSFEYISKLFKPSLPMGCPSSATNPYTSCVTYSWNHAQKSFENLRFGLFMYSESIYRIILLKPKLSALRLPEARCISIISDCSDSSMYSRPSSRGNPFSSKATTCRPVDQGLFQ